MTKDNALDKAIEMLTAISQGKSYDTLDYFRHLNELMAARQLSSMAGDPRNEVKPTDADTNEVTFFNVEISIAELTAKDAYALLCKALSDIGAEFKTDTFITSEDAVGEDRCTSELWGEVDTPNSTL